MARIDTYGPDLSLSNKDKLFGSSYIRTVNNIDEFETKNFTLENLKSFLDSELGADTVALKENGGIVREIISNNTYLAIDLGASDITGQLANTDLANSSITINGTSVDLGGSIVIGEVSEVIAGTYLNGGGTEGTVTLNHDNTSRSDTTSTPSQSGYGTTFTAITSVTTNSTGHLTSVNTATYTLPVSDNTDNYVDSIAVTGTTTKTITLGRTGALSDLTATFTDNDTIPNDATIALSAGTYISGGGDFTTDQSSAETITFNHDNTTRTDTTSSVGPNHGANFTVIDTLTSNATGHITAANVKTVTLPNGANDNTITLSAGTYLSGGGDFTVDQSFNETLTINHDSTTRSDTTSTDNNNSHEDTFTVVDSISTNATGHVTGINVKTVSFPADTNQDIDVNVSNLETRLGQIGNTSIGSSGSTITIPNLTVTGTQTINNVEVISTSSGIVFEGTSNDANETTLNVINPTADRAINLPNKSGTVALLDDIPTVNDGTLTVQGSSGLTGSGTFTANDADSPTITISHADTSSQSSVNNSGNTFIQDITVDTYGHITGITSGTATDNDTITQIREDNSSYRTGNITLQSGTNVNITEPSAGVFNFAATDTNTTYSAGGGLDLNGTVFSHTDTSSQSSVNNSGRTYIQDITLDTYGHVTGLTSATETVTDTNNYVTGASVTGTTTKTLTLTRQGLSDLTATWTDIDTNTDNYVTGASVTGTTTKTLTLTRSGGLSNLTATWADIDTDTTYSAGNGLSLSGTQFNADINYISYSGSNNFIVYGSQNNLGSSIPTNAIIIYQDTSASQIVSRGYVSDLPFLTSESDTLATVTGRGNVTSTAVDLRSSTPLIFTSNGNTGTYTQTTIYANQNNTSGSYANGIFIERGRLANNSTSEIRHFVIGARGGSRQFVFTQNKLGIGVDSPDYVLHTLGSADERLKIECTGNNTAGIYMQVKSAGAQVGTGTVRVDNSGNMNFFVGSSSEAERFRIYGPTGQVSVGVSTVPSNIKFQSDGDIRINSTSGSLWIGGYNDSQAGRVRLHNSNGAGYLDWEAATGTSSFIFRYDTSSRFEMSSGGTFTASADIVAYGSPSDITLKENIKPIENALDKVEKLQGVTFDWKESDSILNIKEDIGFIAQDVQKVLPELVRENENGKLSLRHQGIVPILLEAIKELSDKVKALENGITK